jgi:hypothetical protein
MSALEVAKVMIGADDRANHDDPQAKRADSALRRGVSQFLTKCFDGSLAAVGVILVCVAFGIQGYLLNSYFQVRYPKMRASP